MLARDLASAKPAAVDLDTLARHELDIRDAVAFERALERYRPDWVFNCAGLTNVEVAQADRETAFAVNADAVERMAQLCCARGTRLLHFSTDYVFDGSSAGFYSEDDTPRPLNVYGQSKLAGERAVQRSGVLHLIIRTQWLFGTGRRCFARLMYERAMARQPTRVVADQLGCATYTVDLAPIAWQLIQGTQGIVHVTNRGHISKYDLAARIFTHVGVSSLVEPCTAEEFGSTTPRPANSALSICRAEAILGRRIPSWDDALDRYLAELVRAA